MAELRFDGRVAVITGAGRGLGRAYALLLAARGAKVVVNDPGASLEGDGIDSGPAQQVVDEIRAAGGEAVACTNSVATAEGGKAIIGTALDHFGRIDILIHNAGIVRRASLKEITYRRTLSRCSTFTCAARFMWCVSAFPLMCKAGYGRIVLTVVDQRSVRQQECRELLCGQGRHPRAVECRGAWKARDEGVKCNVISAGRGDAHGRRSWTRALIRRWNRRWLRLSSAGWRMTRVPSPAILQLDGGRAARAYVAESPGVYRPAWTIEQVATRASMPSVAPMRR